MELLSTKSEGSVVGALIKNIVPVAIAGVVAILGIGILGPGFGLILAGAVVLAMYHKTTVGVALGAVLMLSGIFALLGVTGGL